MNAITAIWGQFEAMRRLSDAALDGISDEMLNWVPGNEANPIRAVLVHVIGAEDRFIQALIQGQPTIWDSQGWAERVGLPMLPVRGGGWDEAKTTTVSIEPIMAYGQAVRAATIACLNTLTEADLDRKVQWVGGERSVGEALGLCFAQSAFHAGEISVLKGLQGSKGLPF